MTRKKVYNHGVDTDRATLAQFEECVSKEFVVSAALMPDAHLGYAAPIGAVLKTKNFIVPAWVGFDIGCGVTAIKIGGRGLVREIENKKEQIYSKVRKKIPMGVGDYTKPKNISEKTRKEFQKLVKKFQKGDYDKTTLNVIKTSGLKHLGTLGGGNHFVEIAFDEKKGVWLIVHSGSRGLGHTIGKRYMISAAGSEKEKEFEKTFPLETKSQLGREYLNVLKFGQSYALLNRLEIAGNIIKCLEKVLNKKLKYSLWANKNHNSAVYEKGFYIHRKGATPAKKGERGIIPGNMKDGTFLVKGLGNSKFLLSSSHGAGRRMSITKARKNLSLKKFKQDMEGIKTNVSGRILSESPDAYKNIFKVMDAQKKSIKIYKHLKPIINWKG